MTPEQEQALAELDRKVSAALAEHHQSVSAAPMAAHRTPCERLKRLRGLFDVVVGGMGIATPAVPLLGGIAALLKLGQSELAAACPHDNEPA